MPLPGIFEPSDLPAFLAAAHASDPDDLYSTSEQGTGHTRKRKLYTSRQRRVAVARLLTPAQSAAYKDWFENSITVGETHFTASVANIGPGQLYFDACWLAPYQSVPIATPKGVFWRIAGNLLLTGVGVAERPLDGALSVEYSAGLTGSGTIVAPMLLAVEYAAHLSAAIQLAVEYSAGLIPETIVFLQREDGTDFEREDFGHIQRE